MGQLLMLLVGTYTFTNGANAQKATINSFACRGSMSYQMEIAGSQRVCRIRSDFDCWSLHDLQLLNMRLPFTSS